MLGEGWGGLVIFISGYSIVYRKFELFFLPSSVFTKT